MQATSVNYFGCNYALYYLIALDPTESMYKCSKEDPDNARDEETEKRSAEMPMRNPKKVTVAGNPVAPINVPESRYIDE